MPATTDPTPIERESDDPDQRYRTRCAERLADAMDLNEVNRKELQRRLAAAGHPVTQQAISLWLNGDRLPRPSMQVAIAQALGVRARSIYDIEQAA